MNTSNIDPDKIDTSVLEEFDCLAAQGGIRLRFSKCRNEILLLFFCHCVWFFQPRCNNESYTSLLAARRQRVDRSLTSLTI